MKLDELIKKNWQIGILTVFTILCLFLSLFDSIFLLLGYSGFGFLIGWVIYSKGFLNIHIPKENAEKEKKMNSDYYSVDKWTTVDQKKGNLLLKAVILIVILWVVFSVLLNNLNQIQNVFPSEIETWIKTLISASWVGLVGFVILLYISVIFASILKRLPDELTKVFRGQANRLMISLGFILFLGIGTWGILMEHISEEAFLLGLLIFPTALFISRIQGSFFYLFSIDQWYQVRNYSILEGQKLRDNRTTLLRQGKGVLNQIRALVVILIIPISLISTLLALYDFISGNFISDEPGLLETVIGTLIPTNFVLITLMLLSLGPLLVLIAKPFAFVEVWLNQGLYEKISSPWDLDTANDNFERYHTLFPFPNQQPGFRWSLLIAGIGVVTLFGLNLNASIASSDLTIVTSLIEGLILVSFVTNIIFLLTLIELNWDLIEEKTLWIFGRESRKNNRNLMNYSLYGEYLLFNNKTMDDYIQKNPKSWGLPWFLKGLNPIHSNDDRLSALEIALAEDQVLIPSVIPVAWNDYGVLLSQKGRLDEAEKAFETALKLLGKVPKKAPLITEKLDDFAVPNMPVAQMEIIEPVPNMPISQMRIDEPVPNMPISQKPIKEPEFVSQSRPVSQMAPSSSSSSSSRSIKRRESSLISFEELRALDDEEGLRDNLEARYRRRPATKAAYNIEVIRQRREKMLSKLKKIKELDTHLETNPEDVDKWIELGDACTEVDYLPQAKNAYKKALVILKEQGRESNIKEIEDKLEEFEED